MTNSLLIKSAVAVTITLFGGATTYFIAKKADKVDFKFFGVSLSASTSSKNSKEPKDSK